MLIPAAEHLSASAVALVEPWACVEDAYASRERTTIKPGGRMLIVCEEDIPLAALRRHLERYGSPNLVTWLPPRLDPPKLSTRVTRAPEMNLLSERGYDDIIYFGARAEIIEGLFPKLAPGGLFNIALCGKCIPRPVATAVGRVHYGGIRLVGTTGFDPAESMATISATGEIRNGETINIIGAGGPMGVMHVIRDICLGLENIKILASDLDETRLSALSRIVGPLAERHGVSFSTYDPRNGDAAGRFTYIVLLAPAPALVEEAVAQADQHAIINVFAGLPAEISVEIDLNAYIEKKLYFIGTSGSVLADMEIVLRKAEAGALDTNLSVAAVSGLEGALMGMRAIEQRQVPGKIVVYPCCQGLSLARLEELQGTFPEVARHLSGGLWTPEAEKALLAAFGAERSWG